MLVPRRVQPGHRDVAQVAARTPAGAVNAAAARMEMAEMVAVVAKVANRAV